MSRTYANNGNKHFSTSWTPTAPPFTWSVWFRMSTLPTTVGNEFSLVVGNQDHTATGSFFNFRIDDGGGNNYLQYSVTSAGSATITTELAIDTWYHGCIVEASTSSHSVFLDGGSKVENTGSGNPAADEIQLGNFAGFSDDFVGELAHFACWDIALSDTEIALLGAGVSPLRIQPDSLEHYYPLFGTQGSAAIDYGLAKADLTMSGTVAAGLLEPPVQPLFGFDSLAPLIIGAAPVEGDGSNILFF